jgi:hypothetical protein
LGPAGAALAVPAKLMAARAKHPPAVDEHSSGNVANRAVVAVPMLSNEHFSSPFDRMSR